MGGFPGVWTGTFLPTSHKVVVRRAKGLQNLLSCLEQSKKKRPHQPQGEGNKVVNSWLLLFLFGLHNVFKIFEWIANI